MIDFHTHILPGIDDGCKTVDEALAVLKIMYANGIKTVAATPHYYGEKNSIGGFLNRRNDAYRQIVAAAERNTSKIPKILLGAEVAYFPGISRFEKIEQLCIGDTQYMLLEMPFARWDSFVIGELQKMIAFRGIVPIIAHVERYPGHKNMLETLRDLQLPIQINANSLLKMRTSSFLLKRICDGTVQVLGSDCHDIYARPPNMHLAMEKIEKKLGTNYTEKLGRVWQLMLKCVRLE